MEPKNRKEIEPLLELSAGTMSLVPFDGCAEFVANTADDFTNFMKEVYGSPHLIGRLTLRSTSIASVDTELPSRLWDAFLRSRERLPNHVWL